MPTIPYRARPYAGPSETIRDPESPRRTYSLPVRMRTATHRRELTRRLADGVDPETQAELSLCAAQLTSPRRRKSLARSLRRTVAEVHKPPVTRAHVLIIRPCAVIDAEGAIKTLIDRLSNTDSVRAEGMAIVEGILANSDRSPLYNATEAGSLRRQIMLATAALDPAPEQLLEVPVAA